MTQIILPNQNITGPNLWSQVEDNDVAIRDVVNGDLDATNLADDAVTAAKLRDDASTDSNRAVTTNHIRNGAVTSPKLNLSVTAATNGADVISSGNTEETAIVTASLDAGTYLVLFSGNVRVNETVSTCFVRVKAGSTTLQTLNPQTSGADASLQAQLPTSISVVATTANAGTFSVTIQAPTTGFGSSVGAGSILTVIRIG
jgi:hypothetical protein